MNCQNKMKINSRTCQSKYYKSIGFAEKTFFVEHREQKYMEREKGKGQY